MSYNNPEKRAIADGSDQTDADQQSHPESPLTRQQIDSLPITVFISESRSTSTGSEITSDWKELREFLSEVKPNEAGLPLAEYKAASSEEQREQKDGWAVIPGIVGGDGRRIKENVLALTLIMVDIDDGF